MQDFMKKFTDAAHNIAEIIRTNKAEFQAVIKDKSIPIEERWKMFENFGSVFLSSSGWIEHYSTIEERYGDDAIGYGGSICYVERHEDVILLDVVTNIMEHEAEELEIDFEGVENLEFILEIKEEILQKGIYSFTYDW